MDFDLLLDIEAPPLPAVDKVYDFYVTTSGGLEEIALRELRNVLGQVTNVRVEKGRRIGRIFFHYTRSPKKLLELRCVENVYALLGYFKGVTVGQPGLLAVAKRVGKMDLVPAAVLHDILHGVKELAHFQLSCTVGKGHRFSASELHQMVQTVLTLQYDLEASRDSVPYQIQVQVRGKKALVGMQLTGEDQKKRPHREIEVDGDLPSAVAHCIGLIAQVKKNHVCLDVRCGGGVSLLELNTDRATLIGVEAYFDVVLAAEHNAQTIGTELGLATADPEALCIKTDRVDRLICNLMRRKGEPPIGLMALFGEIVRVLKSDGIAVVIAENREHIKRTLDDYAQLKQMRRLPLHLRGRHPDIYVLQKR